MRLGVLRAPAPGPAPGCAGSVGPSRLLGGGERGASSQTGRAGLPGGLPCAASCGRRRSVGAAVLVSPCRAPAAGRLTEPCGASRCRAARGPGTAVAGQHPLLRQSLSPLPAWVTREAPSERQPQLLGSLLRPRSCLRSASERLSFVGSPPSGGHLVGAVTARSSWAVGAALGRPRAWGHSCALVNRSHRGAHTVFTQKPSLPAPPLSAPCPRLPRRPSAASQLCSCVSGRLLEATGAPEAGR